MCLPLTTEWLDKFEKENKLREIARKWVRSHSEEDVVTIVTATLVILEAKKDAESAKETE